MLKTLLEREIEMFEEKFCEEVTIEKGLYTNQFKGDVTPHKVQLWLTAHDERVLGEIKRRIEKVKFSGDFLHDGDVYSPKEINAILDDLLQTLE